MKKNLLLAIMAVLVSGCATTHRAWTEKASRFQPEAYKRVAIFPLYGDVSGVVADAMTTQFMGMGYEVVERSNLKAVLEEMNLDYSGVLNTAQTKEIARLTNADAIVFGAAKTTIHGGIYFADLRFVDVNTGEILWSSNYINGNSKAPKDSITEISESIQKKINKPIETSSMESRGFATKRLRIAQNPVLSQKRYKKVALLPLAGTNIYGEKYAAYGALITDLIGHGVEFVERKELGSILNEQLAAESGIYRHISESLPVGARSEEAAVATSTTTYSKELSLSSKKMAEIGLLTGADALLIGSFQPVFYSPFTFTIANLRVLDLESGRIAWAATYYNKDALPEPYHLTADWLSIAIAPVITADDSNDYAKKYGAAIKKKKGTDFSIIEKISPAVEKKRKGRLPWER